MIEIKKTPLNAAHRALNAKMVDFGGWDMPVQYSGIIEEHQAVRTKAGLFDVSHMGEIRISGKDAASFIQRIITNDINKLKENGQITYALFCLPSGGVVDDLLVYRVKADEYLLVVNASNTDKDYAWILENKKDEDVEIVNESDETGQIAIQGPLAVSMLQKLTETDLSSIKYYSYVFGKVDGVGCILSRTGYTGEDGFEVYCPAENTEQLWDKMLEVGGDDILPCGLGARDTLRFECKMPLYGHELGEEITPLEAGCGFAVALKSEDDFIGKKALLAQKEAGVPRKVVGLEMIGRGIARAGYPVKVDDKEIGFVTTGSFSPTFNKNLALALIDANEFELGKRIVVQIRKREVEAEIVKSPFYKRG